VDGVLPMPQEVIDYINSRADNNVPMKRMESGFNYQSTKIMRLTVTSHSKVWIPQYTTLKDYVISPWVKMIFINQVKTKY
jgi:hypothetical protein